jgi:hypothetical protein
MNITYEAEIIQHAVGQGGFLTGLINETNLDTGRIREFSYVFDCGSIQKKCFERELDGCTLKKLDVLFISHLDSDHVNGIEKLTVKLKPEAVVLPCIDVLQATALAITAIDDNSVNSSVALFLENPIKWFGDRGVRKVYFVERYTGDQGTSRRDDIFPEPYDDVSVRLPYRIKAENIIVDSSHSTIEQVNLKGDVDISVGSNLSKGQKIWELIPHVHEFPDEKLMSFYKELFTIIGIVDSTESAGTGLASTGFRIKLLDALRHTESRRAIKRCYKHLHSNYNRPSMSLYSGPSRDNWNCRLRAGSIHTETLDCPTELFRILAGGAQSWLSTGDADLRSKSTSRAWLRRYECYLRHVSVFVLPHHGSSLSINCAIISKINYKTHVAACAATISGKHPSLLLKRLFKKINHPILQISEDPESYLSLHYRS